MNSALTFLGIAAAIAVFGGLAVAVAHRNPEAASDDGVGQFQRIMDALAPEDDERVSGVRPDAAQPGAERPTPDAEPEVDETGADGGRP